MLILNYRQTVKDNSVLFFVNCCSIFRILFGTKIKYFWPLVITQCQRAYSWSFWNKVENCKGSWIFEKHNVKIITLQKRWKWQITRKYDEVSRIIIMILNFDVNFNFSKHRKNKHFSNRQYENLYFHEEAEAWTWIILCACWYAYHWWSYMNRHQMRRFSWFRLLIGLLYTSAFK